MKRRGLRLVAYALLLCAVISSGFAFAGVATAQAAELNGGLLFEETFDDLTDSEFAEKYAQLGNEESGIAALENGGVTAGGKVLKIEKWAAVETSAPLGEAEELTITAWVRACSSENRLFGVRHNEKGAYYIKGGAIADDRHSVVAWSNADGAAIVNNDPDFMGIYEKDGEGYYALTVTVTRQSIKFYKNAVLTDSYYTCNDRATGDVQKFIDTFYEGLKNNKILFGGGAFFTEYLQPYYLDEIRVYDYAVRSYGDLYDLLAVNKENLLPQYAAKVQAAKLPEYAEEKPPVLFYDFSSFAGNAVINGGAKAGADATLEGEWDITNGELVLNGNGYMSLPANALSSSEGDFTVSMEIRRSTAYNPDMFYWFSPAVGGNAPSGMNFADCWFKTKSDDAVARNISWIITDYCDESGANPHWNYMPVTPDLDEFTLTAVYCGNKFTVYVNGHRLSEQTVADGIAPADFAHGFIGRGFWDRANFRGAIDNVAVYDYAVSPSTAVRIANRLYAFVDLPADAEQGSDIASRFYYEYGRFYEHGQNPADLLENIAVDFTEKKTQTETVREGVTITVYFRDIEDVSENVTYTVRDTLPSEIYVPYSDGSQQLLKVDWDGDYAFGTLSEYTGTATDRVGRESRVTYRVRYSGGKEDLQALVSEAASVLDYEPLYSPEAFAAYESAVRSAYERAKEICESSESHAEQILAALSELKAATEKAALPVRNRDLQLFSVEAVLRGADVTVTLKGTHDDTVRVGANGLTLTVYDPLQPSNSVTDSQPLEDGEYEIKIVRKTEGGGNTAVLNVYVTKGGEIVARIENAVSENLGAADVSGASKTDCSLLLYYTGINRRDYTTESVEAFESVLAEHKAGANVTDWLNLTQAEAKELSGYAKQAHSLLKLTKIQSVAPFTDLRCKAGTDITPLLPAAATVTFDNQTKAALKIKWNTEQLDSNAAGEYVVTGTVLEKDGSEYTVSLNVTVEGQTPPDTDGGCGSAACGAAIAFPVAGALLITAGIFILFRYKKAKAAKK